MTGIVSEQSSTTEIAFNANVGGVILPRTEFTNFVDLLYKVLPSLDCKTGYYQSCHLNCSDSGTMDVLLNYYFELNPTSSNVNYLRVPLSTFISSSSSNGTCYLQVLMAYEGMDNYGSGTITFGSMFFEQFYGHFTNTYDSQYNFKEVVMSLYV